MASPPKLPPKLNSSDSFKSKEKLLEGPSPTNRPVPKPRRNARASLSPTASNPLPRPKPRPRTMSKEKVFSEEGDSPREVEVFETNLDNFTLPPDADEAARMVEDMVEKELEASKEEAKSVPPVAPKPANQQPRTHSPVNHLPITQQQANEHPVAQPPANEHPVPIPSMTPITPKLANQHPVPAELPSLPNGPLHTNTNPIYDLQEFVGTRTGKGFPDEIVLQPEKVENVVSNVSAIQTNSDSVDNITSDDIYENMASVAMKPETNNNANITDPLKTLDKYGSVDKNHLFGPDLFSGQPSLNMNTAQVPKDIQTPQLETSADDAEDESMYEPVWFGNGAKKTPAQVPPSHPKGPPPTPPKAPHASSMLSAQSSPMSSQSSPLASSLTSSSPIASSALQPPAKAPQPPAKTPKSPHRQAPVAPPKKSIEADLLSMSQTEPQQLTFVPGKASSFDSFPNESSTDDMTSSDRWGEYVGLNPQASLYEQPPPLHPPPPLPEDAKMIPGAPPVPPRPSATPKLPDRPSDKPPLNSSNSAVFEALETPKAPLEDDPFKYSDFATECKNFNRSSVVPPDAWSSSSSNTDAFGEKEDTFDPFGLQSSGSGSSGNWAAAAVEYAGSGKRISLSNVPPAPQGHTIYSRSAKTPEQKDDLYSVATDMEATHDSSDSSEEPFSSSMLEVQSRFSESSAGSHSTMSESSIGSVPIIPGHQQKKTERIGYLYKQGGFKANRGWRRRWVIFNGRDLRYYVNNRSQISKRVIPLKCMKKVETDVRTDDTSRFKFKLLTTLKDRVFLFAAETLDDCLTWAQTLMAAIELYEKNNNGFDDNDTVETPDKEGFIKFENGGRKYYVCIRGSTLSYYNNIEDFRLCSPVHEISMELASVKDVGKCKLQLSTHYAYFILSFDTPGEAQGWKMAIEEAVAEGLADDSVLNKVYENDSNRICADCESSDPHWASINMGIVVCKKCAGIHRMFEAGISKIRSLRMDTRVWTPSLIELMKAIGNANANEFWEFEMLPEHKIEPDSTTEERKTFILNKYKHRRYCHKHTASTAPRLLNEELLRVAATDELLELVSIVFSGADIHYQNHSNPEETAYHLAKSTGKRLLMEFLYQNGGDSPTSDAESNEGRLREDVRHQGYLYKTGPNQRGFDKRWCVLEHGALSYYQTETSTTAKDSLERQCIYTIQETSVEKQQFAMELSTNKNNNRVYLFACEDKAERGMWIRSIGKVVCPVAIMEHVGMMDFSFGGNFYVKDAVSEEWRKTWLMLSWRILHYMGQNLKLEMLDLRKAISIKYQDMDHSCKKCVEMGPHFVINAPNKALYIQADLTRDTEKAFHVIELAMKESGRTVQDQQLTSEDVPVIVDRCINHITQNGLKSQGIYREGAQHSRVQLLLTELRKDARSVRLDDFSCNEVANAMKRFFRELEDSLFTKDAYSNWIGTAAVPDHSQKVRWYRYLLNKLPMVNYNTLKKIVLHLHRVAEHFSENRMTQENLATCFAPSLMSTESTREGSGMGGALALEMAVLTDIVRNQEVLLPVQAHQKMLENQISQAEDRIKQMTRESARRSCVIDKMITPIHMYNIDGACETLPISSSDTAHTVIRAVKEKSKISGDFTLSEVLLGGSLERPIPQDEAVLRITTSWGNLGDDISADAKLCFKTIDYLEKMQNALDPCQMLFSEVKYYSEKRKPSKQVFQYKQGRLVCFKDTKGTKVHHSWNVEDIVLYIGIDQRRRIDKGTGYGLTFVDKKEKANKEYFGRSLLFPTEKDMMKWASALLVAQYPDGIIASFS